MASVTIDSKRIAELAEREEKRLEDETPKSYELFKRASKSLVNGVASTYQMRDPYPVYFTPWQGLQDLLRRRSRAQRLPQRLRLHGAGTCSSGHHRSHPASAASWARSSRCPRRTPIIVAEHLAKNFRSAQVALRQLRVRGHHGRHPHRPRVHRPRAGGEDLRLLPRPSRLRHGEPGRGRLGRDRSRATTTSRSPTAPASPRPSST